MNLDIMEIGIEFVQKGENRSTKWFNFIRFGYQTNDSPYICQNIHIHVYICSIYNIKEVEIAYLYTI